MASNATSISNVKKVDDEKRTPRRPLMVALQSLISNNSAIAGMSIIGALVFIAIFAPLIATHNPIQQLIGEPGYVGRLGGRGPCIPFLGNLGCGDLPNTVDALTGQPFRVAFDDGGTLVLNDGQARIVEADLSSMGNSVQVIDGVLVPDNPPRPLNIASLGLTPPVILGNALDEEAFSILFEAIEKANFTDVLANTTPWTLFAPTNDAWEAYFAETGTTLEDIDAEDLRLLLAYHVTNSDEDIESLETIAGAQHNLNIMGIDRNSRDLYSRVIYGSRISLTVGIAAVSFAIVVGTLTGLVSGYAGGWVDNLIMRVMDVLLAFPSLLLAIAIVTILGPGLQNALLAIAIVSIPQYARLVRSSVLSIKEQEFVTAEKALGGGPIRIIFIHVLPNAITPIIVQGTLGIGTAILDAAALSFLGLGAQPPTPEWGFMLSEARADLRAFPHLMFFPGVAIMITVLGFNLLGDGMRDAFDPRLRG